MSDNLCVSCSLCCNGSLFSRVPITAEEKTRMGGGPNFFRKGDEYRMKQSCTYLGYECACQCYDIRPKTCRTYKCRLLKRVEANETSEFEATELVAEIKNAQKKAKVWIAKALNKQPQELTMTLVTHTNNCGKSKNLAMSSWTNKPSRRQNYGTVITSKW